MTHLSKKFKFRRQENGLKWITLGQNSNKRKFVLRKSENLSNLGFNKTKENRAWGQTGQAFTQWSHTPKISFIHTFLTTCSLLLVLWTNLQIFLLITSRLFHTQIPISAHLLSKLFLTISRQQAKVYPNKLTIEIGKKVRKSEGVIFIF